tara:strand:- start:1111 stop:1293 length:183 start_codon:yes stop_codon:yes gene_type:complete
MSQSSINFGLILTEDSKNCCQVPIVRIHSVHTFTGSGCYCVLEFKNGKSLAIDVGWVTKN